MTTGKTSAVRTMTDPMPPKPDAQASTPGASLGQVTRAITDEIGLTTPESSADQTLSAQQIYMLIQESAYYRAEARGFSPGYEEQDWLEAEAEIKARLGAGGS